MDIHLIGEQLDFSILTARLSLSVLISVKVHLVVYILEPMDKQVIQMLVNVVFMLTYFHLEQLQVILMLKLIHYVQVFQYQHLLS